MNARVILIIVMLMQFAQIRKDLLRVRVKMASQGVEWIAKVSNLFLHAFGSTKILVEWF